MESVYIMLLYSFAKKYMNVYQNVLIFILSPENVEPRAIVFRYSVAVQSAGSIEQNHTRCPMLSTMYKTQTSQRRDLLQMSHFIPAEVELLR